MPSQFTDSDPIQTSYAACSTSAGDVPEEDGALFGSMKDEPAIVVTNAVHSLDVGAPFVADHAAGSPHRPLINTGVDGDAISDELGLNPGVDGSTPESIARIARKYSLANVVDGLLNKAPFEFQEVRSISLSGCPVKGSKASVAVAEMICDSGCGLELALPNVDPYAVIHCLMIMVFCKALIITCHVLYGFLCTSGTFFRECGCGAGLVTLQSIDPGNKMLYAEVGTRCTASGVQYGCFC
ncbi:hypothetical protein Nepgr_007989 [Nepenthes gracilis]|uniref:Uncharacterized protein n=1 Tax=Nepenthes gracilis TaxID=150966 RepID=A0AAD3XIV0_NEPGR|nr:hypothetical protein Nepgr_007989 [Nepenthes gracilis]